MTFKTTWLNSISIAVTMAFVTALAACTGTSNQAPSKTALTGPATKAANPGFQKVIMKTGKGAPARTGNIVSVHYTGWLYDPNASGNKGEKFDSSVDRGQPFAFSLGSGNVIKGWDNGIIGMKVGGKRKLIIPPSMGYGEAGSGSSIPPNSTLLFDVELLGIR